MLEFLGLPAHVLFLHAVPAFAPLAGLTGIVYALRPPWRRVLEWPGVVLAVLTAGLTVLTASAGEALEHALPPGELIEAHAEQGERLQTAAGPFAVAVVLAVAATGPWTTSRVGWLAKARDVRWLAVVVQTLTVLAGLFLVYQVVVTGYTGAEAVWSDWRTG
jgi:hypothetical protein